MKGRFLLFLFGLLFFFPPMISAEEGKGGIVVPDNEKPVYSLEQWSDENRGSHRAVIQVEGEEDLPSAVRVYIPWRRHDQNPESKRLILTREDGSEVDNLRILRFDRESVDLAFEPGVSGIFYLYYLPHTVQPGSGYYAGGYLPPKETASEEWIAENHLETENLASAAWKTLPEAKLLELQARGAFESFDPMEVAAKRTERDALVEKYSQEPFLLFPEDRRFPIVMTGDLPLRWIEEGPRSSFYGKTQKNEYYTFQIGLFASQEKIDHIQVQFSDLQDASGNLIPADSLTCFNLGGINSHGEPFVKRLDLEKDQIQALWFGVDIAPDQKPGLYTGSVSVTGENLPSRTIQLKLTVENTVLADRGDSEIWRHSRLRWLNSRLGIDDDVYPPFTPIQVKDRTLGIIGREVRFAETGFPEQIFCAEKPLLSAPIQMILADKEGKVSSLKSANAQWTKLSPGTVVYESIGEALSLPCQYQTKVQTDFDGHINFQVHLRATETMELSDILLKLPLCKEMVPYLMGLGQNGGTRPDSSQWKWGGPVYYDSFWLGDVHGGLQCELRGANYSGPMVNLYWNNHQLLPPESWDNHGKGECVLSTRDDEVIVEAKSGERTLSEGEEITFEFALIITPVKPLDPKKQFTSRYYHSPAPMEVVEKAGANIINIHHANRLNLYINYPFLTVPQLREHIQNAHWAKKKLKIYYTVRELTNHIGEWAAIRSLGTEILADGPGGGYPWLQEHFGDHYTPAWYDRLDMNRSAAEAVPLEEVSAAVVTTGDSRWLNYYVEGLRWLLVNMEIDGLYLDDVSYDRTILRRMRSVMEKYRAGCMIDLHSNTGFSHNPANQYLEFFPYIDKLWFGESFDYEKTRPDYWLTEISGIPFGVMGEMLQNGGNPWRGMVYGMTARLPWTDVDFGSVTMLWKVWDQFGIADAQMIGYWEPTVPVKTDYDDILVTVYRREGKTLLALASWHPESVECRLQIDWDALGLDPEKVQITAPEMRTQRNDSKGNPVNVGFQEGRTFTLDEPIPVEPNRGWLLILEENDDSLQ